MGNGNPVPTPSTSSDTDGLCDWFTGSPFFWDEARRRGAVPEESNGTCCYPPKRSHLSRERTKPGGQSEPPKEKNIFQMADPMFLIFSERKGS